VLQITEMERADIELKKENIRLHESIKSITSSVEIKLSKQQGELMTNLAAEDDLIRCDKLHLTNIIYNVIDNALKYSNKKTKINIETKQLERFLQLTITDNGIGIAEEHIANVSRKFYRVPTGKVHNVKGFGLGLYYVNQVCKAHDWQWEIKSKIGKGTSITFKIKK
jgi:two-component system phosphate regulon sensor histidine kinase PhoR